MKALEDGLLETIIIFEGLEARRLVLYNKEIGKKRILYLKEN